MGRSLKKGPYVDAKLMLKVERQKKAGGREPITTWARECTVVPDFVGHTFMVHNGRTHLKVFVTEDMVGHRLGEFSQTRTFRGHSTRKPEGEAAAPAAPARK
jgi:small subunit ribosomal protein S19